MLHKLTIPQQFFLLALDDTTGRFKPGMLFSVELFAATCCFFELLRRDIIDIKDNIITLKKEDLTGIDYLDSVIKRFKDDESDYLDQHIIEIGGFNDLNLQGKIITSLVDLEILNLKTHRIWFLIPFNKLLNIETVDEKNTITNIKNLISGKGEVKDKKTSGILALMCGYGNFLADFADEEEREAFRKNFENFLEKKETFFSPQELEIIETFQKARSFVHNLLRDPNNVLLATPGVI